MNYQDYHVLVIVLNQYLDLLVMLIVDDKIQQLYVLMVVLWLQEIEIVFVDVLNNYLM